MPIANLYCFLFNGTSMNVFQSTRNSKIPISIGLLHMKEGRVILFKKKSSNKRKTSSISRDKYPPCIGTLNMRKCVEKKCGDKFIAFELETRNLLATSRYEIEIIVRLLNIEIILFSQISLYAEFMIESLIIISPTYLLLLVNLYVFKRPIFNFHLVLFWANVE